MAAAGAGTAREWEWWSFNLVYPMLPHHSCYYCCSYYTISTHPAPAHPHWLFPIDRAVTCTPLTTACI
jgi:hypothetical protein